MGAIHRKNCNAIGQKRAALAEKKQILQDEFHIPMTQEMDREVSFMCNLSQGVWNEGRESGFEDGIVSSIQNLMLNTSWSIEKALSTLGVPRDKWEHYTAKL